MPFRVFSARVLQGVYFPELDKLDSLLNSKPDPKPRSPTEAKPKP